MNNLKIVFGECVSELFDYAGKLELLLGSAFFSEGVGEVAAGLKTQYEQYLKNIQDGDSDRIRNSARKMALLGMELSEYIDKIHGESRHVKLVANSLGKTAEKLLEIVENEKRSFELPMGPPENYSENERVRFTTNLQRIEQVMLEQEKHDARIKKDLAEGERRLVVMEEGIQGLGQKVQEALTKMDDAYSDTLDYLKEKKEEIDSILGHVAGRAIAGDFEKSATAEKAAADWLRIASLLCMALIVLVLGYSFWETTRQDFEWQKSLFRVALAFLLSAPAAYLARESAKHRTQQYVHLQTPLDLKAISPYLSSLPQDIQHRIKGEVAAKLFGGRDYSNNGSDSYPINVQELIMELVKKIEAPKVSAK